MLKLKRTTLPGTGSSIVSYRVPHATAALLMIPGANCRAQRYAWMAALNRERIDVHVLDGAMAAGRFGSSTLDEIAAAIALLAGLGIAIHAAGHSAGAAALLDSLDPSSNMSLNLRNEWRLPQLPRSITSLGCSLQPQALDMVLPHRSEDQPLVCPTQLRLLFLAGDSDAMAPPDRVAATARRYTPPARVIVLAGSTHYGWAGPREPGDDPRCDEGQSLDTMSQRERTLAYMTTMVLHAVPEPAFQDREQV